MGNISIKFKKLKSQKGHRAPSAMECGWGMFSHPPWGEEFEHSEEISKKGWDFKLTKEYRLWECEGIPGRTGTVSFEVLRAPGKTLAQRLYNDDKKNKMGYTEKIDGDIYGSNLVPMQEMINLVYNKLEILIQSNEIFGVCEQSLKDFYKRKIATIKKYGSGD